ncbi:MAG: oxygenase MpaB family protein [Verrucomicrobiales bacterium]|nr:oxygenase MpaB family protein [Verrucomicrobiales bacterium]
MATWVFRHSPVRLPIPTPLPSPPSYVFTPESEIWRVNRYATGLLFGPAAVLLQIAHPRVAQGVADHSDFQNNALGRLRRTLTTVNSIAFGTVEQAEQMRARLKHVHGQVRGQTSPGMQGAKSYSAFEPDLLLWVLATLIDASIKGYEFIWGTLPDDRRENFYRDFRHFGTFFGLPSDQGPANYREFEHYYADMLSSDLLGSHPLSAKVAATVVHPPNPLRDRLLGKLSDFLPVETVPAHIRDRLALTSTPWTRLRMATLRHTAPTAFRILPKRLTYYPESYRAEKNLGLIP